MEGLVPLVCKTLKKSHTRRKYTRLSSSSAAAQSYNISDFYPQGFSYQYSTPQPDIQTSAIGGVGRSKSLGHHNYHHHRHNSSLGEYSSGFSVGGDQEMVIMKPKQLVRFRSHGFFSCVSGAA